MGDWAGHSGRGRFLARFQIAALPWVVVKTRFRLSVDAAEKTALASELTHCPNDVLTVELAR
ncbi:hypothetical protein HUT15_37170 (plasmid) [Streptomyces sp. NA03103]|uniref:hypothetical protein n=1 Tax=Streptomyces sp. NA03103 TaxID=2742134 RepID=UPI001591A025|nr:hypothetical protein [Streptomyces sp. NA03103]QKW66147.1 hypothetical protein HUT15_37170 [Streptomyces sp. NA03103]